MTIEEERLEVSIFIPVLGLVFVVYIGVICDVF